MLNHCDKRNFSLDLRSLMSQVDRVLDSSTPEVHESFFSRFSISNDMRRAFVTEKFSPTTSCLGDNVSAPIPKVIHRIWLTNPENPCMPPDDYLKRISRQLRIITQDYICVFWHNSGTLPERLSGILDSSRITFRCISMLQDIDTLRVIESAVEYKKYVLAGDIAKFAIIYEHGGIYADLGVDFDDRLLALVNGFDTSLFLDKNLFFQPAFMAAPRHFSAFCWWANCLVSPEVISAIGLKDKSILNPGDEIWVHGGIGFTAILMLFAEKNASILPIPPNQGFLHCESQASWYSTGQKFGNVSLRDAPMSHLRQEKHSFLVKENTVISESLSRLGVAGTRLSRLLIEWHLSERYWIR